MLVLSRREQEQIVFPSLNVSIEVTKISGKVARIAVDAPKHIRVLRGELVGQCEQQSVDVESRERRHRIRNHLHTAHMALGLLQKQITSNKLEHAEATLQQVTDAFEQLEPLAVPKQASSQSKSTAKVLRALVVEDNANERELLTGYLSMSGYQVESVPDGLAALEYLQTHGRPDFVLLDMQMPRMDGKQTVAAIRANDQFSTIKLYALSGMDQSTCGIPLGRDGVNRWFNKPIQPSYLAAELSKERISQN